MLVKDSEPTINNTRHLNIPPVIASADFSSAGAIFPGKTDCFPEKPGQAVVPPRNDDFLILLMVPRF